jgi:hypothetical protein
MAHLKLLIWLLLAVFTVALARNLASKESRLTPIRNANHIFNAIHSSMRQWGSSLNHNGMSLFLATVPQDTLLYHGTDKPEATTGMEWLAFERQHALQFARLFLSPGALLPSQPHPEFSTISERPQLRSGKGGSAQRTLRISRRQDGMPDLLWILPGFLHTYKPKQDLRLLYIDGSSAAKTRMGTLDTTDMLLLGNQSSIPSHDDDRAVGLCDVATRWGSHIDGFIRMEAGFEVIMCSFNKSLDLVHIQGVEDINLITGTDDNEVPERDVFEWLRAASMRYDGIGGSPRRVVLNYDQFVTAFAYPFDPFHGNPQAMPRLHWASDGILDDMMHDISSLASDPENFEEVWPRSRNWQDIASVIVLEYAAKLQDLITCPKFSNSSQQLSIELHMITRRFLDTHRQNATEDIERCTFDFFPLNRSPSPPPVAERAIYTISHRICSVLINAAHALPVQSGDAPDGDPSEQLQSLRDLVSYLAWPEWKKCKGCKWGELCSIPMFPYGSAADHEHPRCRGNFSIFEMFGYWSA